MKDTNVVDLLNQFKNIKRHADSNPHYNVHAEACYGPGIVPILCQKS